VDWQPRGDPGYHPATCWRQATRRVVQAKMSRKALPAFKGTGRVVQATALIGDNSPEAFLGNHLAIAS